jgi:hypothetical protein
MYPPSLTHLGNLSGYYNDGDSVYGAEFSEVPALTPYYERAMHYDDQKPWQHPYIESTYLNYMKMMNEPPVVTYKELQFKPISDNNYEIVEHFTDGNIGSCCGNNKPNNTNLTNVNTNNTTQNIIENLDNNNNNMANPYGKILLILFLLFTIYLVTITKS